MTRNGRELQYAALLLSQWDALSGFSRFVLCEDFVIGVLGLESFLDFNHGGRLG